MSHLYDIGSQNGADFLVMEFLEGETLAERLRKASIPFPEIYKIGIAVAEAFSILKPQTPPAFENVLTTCLQKNPEDRYLAARRPPYIFPLELQF